MTVFYACKYFLKDDKTYIGWMYLGNMCKYFNMLVIHLTVIYDDLSTYENYMKWN